jgi:protein-disulfide isomerase
MIKNIAPPTEQDHLLGQSTGRIQLLEYADYQCPHSAAARAILGDVLPTLGAEVSYVFRNFPLPDLHPRAVEAAEAAEAAGAQGKFWEMHNLLFKHQDKFSADDLTRYAKELGLDVERFTREMAEHTHLPRIASDVANGVRSGVPGTPTFFVNGARVEGAFEAEALRDLLVAQIAATGPSAPAAT